MAEEKQTSLKPLTIYFYHTRLTRESYEEWKEYKFPGHILYGLPLLEKHGIHSVMHKCRYFSSRLRLMLYATKEILFCKEKYQVLYVNPEKPDVPLNKNDAFQKVQKRRVQEKR